MSSVERSDHETGKTMVPVNLEMFCWGNTANGELGLGGIEDLHINKPRQLNFEDVNDVKYIACGKFHTVLVTNTGAVFSCGSNDFGQLGREMQQKRFQRVTNLQAHNIRSVECGEFHSLAINEWGQVFSWGDSRHGQLGHGKQDDVWQPRIIKSLATKCVVQISCGYKHCLALTNSGELYAWGACDYGQLGLGYNTSEPISEPTIVSSLIGVPIAFIASGGSHSFAISKSGAVYGWGKNTFGQLGLNSELNHFYPSQLKTLRSIRVKYIACGEDFSVFLTQDGGVFTCGAGQYGQLGHGSNANEILPRKVLELMGTTVTQVTCGRRHTLALVPSRGRIYAFGVGAAGQLGTKTLLNSLTPQVVLGPWVSPSGKSLIENEFCEYVVRRIFAGGDQCFVTVSRQKDNVSPEDLRILDADSQILTLTMDKLKACEELPVNQPVDQELLKYLETVLSSAACLNASFLKEDHYNCSPRHHGIDIEVAKACFTTISRIEHESIVSLIRESFMDHILPQIHKSSPPDVECLRAYITIPFYHEFNNARHASRLQVRYANSLLGLQQEAAKIVGIWYLMMSADYYEHLIFVYKNIVLFTFEKVAKESETHRVPYIYGDTVAVSMDFLSRLNQLNQQMKVPYTTFYIAGLSDLIDLTFDYVMWKDDDNKLESPNRRKFFCDYSFLFDPEVKTQLLETDQAMQMEDAMSQVSVDILRAMLTNNMNNARLTQYFVLKVTRDNIVNDTIEKLARCTREKDLKKPLKVVFIGEEAQDGGGVKKEFFLLLMREILDPKYGMFHAYDETNAIWFSDCSLEESVMYYLIGVVCGLAIYNFTIIALPFPVALYKKLLGEQLVLQDIEGLSPTLARSLQTLLDYPDPDLEDTFCLFFEITRVVFGETKTYSLKPDGGNIPVTQENKQEYVDLYLDYLLNKSVEQQFLAFKDGFFKVCGGRVLKLFRAQELMAVVIGNESYDWEAFEKFAMYKGVYDKDHPIIRMFWNVFHELPETEKKKFLLFLTGTDRIPIQGMKAVKIIIQPTLDDRFLPVAHTCFNLLDLPLYKTREKLRYKLTQAIQQHQGFSLV